MADRVRFRFWTITDYEEEEQFLREQHREGWRLKRYFFPGFYLFDRCTPEDVVYRLDFDQAVKGEKMGYLKMYQDYGWEYLFDVNGFSYFRKSAAGFDEETEIFSDNDSRLEMVRRIFRRRMVPLLCVFLCCLVPQLFIQYIRWVEYGDIGARVLTIIFDVLFVIYVCLFIHCGRGINRLKNKYQKD